VAGSFSDGFSTARIDFPPIVGQGVEAQHPFHQISIELDEDAPVGHAGHHPIEDIAQVTLQKAKNKNQL